MERIFQGERKLQKRNNVKRERIIVRKNKYKNWNELEVKDERKISLIRDREEERQFRIEISYA